MSNLSGAILICFGYSVIYVGSLYFWRSSNSRDHPKTIKQRFFSVFVACLITLELIFLQDRGPYDEWYEIWKLNWSKLYVRSEGLLPAVTYPVILTIILFLGPMVTEYFDGYFSMYLSRAYWTHSMSNLMVIRNILVAPVSEELVFRACMVYQLAPHLTCYMAILISPLFFGTAHLHHFMDKVKNGMSVPNALFTSLFQVMYTCVFGVYSGFIMLRTGHLAAAIVVHMYCNHMGLPNFGAVKNYRGSKRICVIASYIIGFITWLFLLYPLTNPNLYEMFQYSCNW